MIRLCVAPILCKTAETKHVTWTFMVMQDLFTFAFTEAHSISSLFPYNTMYVAINDPLNKLTLGISTSNFGGQ